MARLSFPSYDYQGSNGQWYKLYELSVYDKERLKRRLNELYSYLEHYEDQSKVVSDILASDTYFLFLCNECLEIAGIDTKTVNETMLMQFLFAHTDEDKTHPALLMTINWPGSTEKVPAKFTQTFMEFVASVSTHTEDIEQAIRLCQSMGSSDLQELLDARRKLMDPNAREEDYKRKAREELERDARNQHSH